ncbi:methylamine dehydrogenase accessory protein MauD [Parahaliea mediterranea]|uniref:Methylamine utilization protein MauD n=1 Tax=Parahaliea mediterranea TaxID=651086 RepID=A0A939DHJ3_9GAMM|nr:methylamine dehydrogenase accessory protein MauD [Parahaliea mediterranea]MBN7797592.1 methylamine dehydrogenase accessory protein MauD [Parahaliea mediterranea]
MEIAVIVAVVLQWVLLLGLALVNLAIIRQVGVIHQRIAPAGALMLGSGMGQGEKSPELELLTTDGESLRVGAPDSGGRSTLIMFVSPDCPVCERLIPAIKALGAAEERWLRVLFAGDGSQRDYESLRREKRLQQYSFVLSPELGMRFQVGKLPYGVLLDEHGVLVAQGLTNSREHIESLLEAKRRGVASIQEYLGQQKVTEFSPVADSAQARQPANYEVSQ